jgi:hypothetical protein
MFEMVFLLKSSKEFHFRVAVSNTTNPKLSTFAFHIYLVLWVVVAVAKRIAERAFLRDTRREIASTFDVTLSAIPAGGCSLTSVNGFSLGDLNLHCGMTICWVCFDR